MAALGFQGAPGEGETPTAGSHLNFSVSLSARHKKEEDMATFYFIFFKREENSK